MNQTEILRKAEADLGLGAGQMAQAMGAPYDTYKDWKSGRNRMTPVAIRCLELLRMVRAAGLET